jgi:methionyl-tRNA formyltransferase
MATPEATVAGILTTPPEISISYSERPVLIKTHARFDDLAQQCDCEVITMQGKMNAAAHLQCIHKWQPDLLLALGWYYLIPRHVRNTAPLGCMGIHASLLPKYRGGAPIPWAIINGEQSTGVTLFALDEGVDTGDIIAQGSVPITEHDDCATVYEKATCASVDILRKYLPLIANGSAQRLAQSRTGADGEKIPVYPQRKPDDGQIDWTWGTKKIHDFIRAQTHPYPGAFTYLIGRKLHIWKVFPGVALESSPGEPGQIVIHDGAVGVCTGDGIILITECQLEREKSGPADTILMPHMAERLAAFREQQAIGRGV